MKKFIFSVFALLGMTMSVSAQTLTVDPIDAVPGETVQATLKFSCDADKYVGLMFSLQFPTDIAEKVSVKGLEGLAQPTVGKMDETGKVKFSGINGLDSENNVIYLATSTDLVINIALAEDIPFGNYTIKVTDIQLDQSGTLVPLSDVTFALNVLELPTVTLDEESTIAPEAVNGVNVVVKRTINANEWSTICLPFAMTADQLKKAFGDDVMLAKLGSWTFEGEVSNIESLKFVFTTVTSLDANQPYMIKVGSSITEFKVNKVDIAYVKTPFAKVTYDYDPPFDSADFYVMGTNCQTSLKEGYLFVSENKLWRASGDMTIKGFRAYFMSRDLTVPAAFTRIMMEFGDASTDGVDTVQTGVQDDNYYNLRGQRVDTPAKGIYIKNGKKVVVK